MRRVFMTAVALTLVREASLPSRPGAPTTEAKKQGESHPRRAAPGSKKLLERGQRTHDGAGPRGRREE